MEALEIEAIAQEARRVLERYAATADRTDPLHGFPAGSCGTASELLARYLREVHSLPALYANGTSHRDGAGHVSHAWVEVQGLIVDITADQFPEMPAPVTVTTDRRWHDQWEADRPPRLPITTADQWPAYPLGAWLALLKIT